MRFAQIQMFQMMWLVAACVVFLFWVFSYKKKIVERFAARDLIPDIAATFNIRNQILKDIARERGASLFDYAAVFPSSKEYYADSVHNKQVASDELDEQIKDHNFRATRAIQLKDWKEARKELAMILQKLPDTSDKRYQEAQTRLLDVERRLQPK